MSSVEALLRKYRNYVALPWEANRSGIERVWFVVYNKTRERRIRSRIEEFEEATKSAGHEWLLIDLTNDFAQWMAEHKYRESYFESPDDLEIALDDFKTALANRLKGAFKTVDNAPDTVVAVLGVAGLYGFLKVSELIKTIEEDIQGRLLVFFPGVYESNNYRLLDARDGWNYMAVPITAEAGE